jgi:hypothetical protein
MQQSPVGDIERKPTAADLECTGRSADFDSDRIDHGAATNSLTRLAVQNPSDIGLQDNLLVERLDIPASNNRHNIVQHRSDDLCVAPILRPAVSLADATNSSERPGGKIGRDRCGNRTKLPYGPNTRVDIRNHASANEDAMNTVAVVTADDKARFTMTNGLSSLEGAPIPVERARGVCEQTWVSAERTVVEDDCEHVVDATSEAHHCRFSGAPQSPISAGGCTREQQTAAESLEQQHQQSCNDRCGNVLMEAGSSNGGQQSNFVPGIHCPSNITSVTNDVQTTPPVASDMGHQCSTGCPKQPTAVIHDTIDEEASVAADLSRQAGPANVGDTRSCYLPLFGLVELVEETDL